MTDLRPRLDRREAVARLLQDRGELLVVSGLGSATYDCAAAGDDPRNFYLWGAMGGTAALALGLAQAQPDRPVAAITGDGDMLMGLGSLATIAAAAPANLSVIVLDNEVYGETGAQPTATARGVSLVEVARGCGIDALEDIRDMNALGTLAARDGAYLRSRFREAVLGTGP